MKTATLRADLLLLIAAAIWGSGFVAQRIGMQHVGPLTYTGVRFVIGVLVLLPIVTARRGRNHTTAKWPSWRAGLLLGTVLFAGVTLQQYGLVYTTAGKAGFITGLYVVLVPVIGLLFRQRPHWLTWAGVTLAAVGLYFLSVKGQFQINPGDRYVMACACVWAVHLLLVGWLAPRNDPFELAIMQFAVCALLGLITAGFEQPCMQNIWAARWPILYGGACSVGIAFTLQIVAQRDAPPAHAAILLSFEAVFAALFGWIWLAELFSTREFIGSALMLSGILVSQYRPTRRGSTNTLADTPRQRQ
ncbi:MAG: DMT family transporter [Planctomycetota bacterium]